MFMPHPSILALVGRVPCGAGSPRAFRAWPLAWPSLSGSLGWQSLAGEFARLREAAGAGRPGPGAGEPG